MSDFTGKVAVVLGATSPGGMGEDIAADLAAHGATVVVSGRDAARAATLAAKISGKARPCDLTVEAQIEALMEFAAQLSGKIDIVVNAAGLGGVIASCLIRDIDQARLDTLTRVNMIGPLLAMKHAAAHMSRGSVFVQFTTIAAQQPTEFTVGYSSCKAGLEAAIRVAALEYGPLGLRFVGVAPGIIFTPMTAMITNESVRRTVESVTPLGRMVERKDVTALVRFLVSDDCYETGHIYPVSGGAAVSRSLRVSEFVME